jgi:hypothetical protein
MGDVAFDYFSESGSIPKSCSRCRRAAAALGNRYGAWRSMASMISMGSMVAMGNRWGAEVKCFDGFVGGFAFEGCA